MVLSQIPVVVLVFAATWLAAPLIYTLDKLAMMEQPIWVFMAGVITLPLFGLMSIILARDSPGKKEPLFYVFSIFAFTAVVDLFIGLELDGYVSGFMEFYLREGEPYLRSSYGTLINWWDGTGHYAMYLAMIALMCAGKDYRLLGLYWFGSIMNSMIVFMPGNVTGNKGIRWSYLLNVPYVYYPIYAVVRFLRDGMKQRTVQPTRKKQAWESSVEFLFGAWFVFAIGICMFRMVACMGCSDDITTYYMKNIEPYLGDPTQYGRMQALVFFYYFIPYFAAALCCLIYPGQTWFKDWSLIFAGASIQAQLVYMWCSLQWRTDPAHRVPDTPIAQSIFWTVNFSLVLVPHLFAIYLHRYEIHNFITKEAVPGLKTLQGEVKTSQTTTKRIEVTTYRRDGPVTRQQKKIN